MKKVVLSAAVCAMAFSANAEDVAVVTPSQTGAFSCLYGGLGVGGSFLETSDMDYFEANGKQQNKVKTNRFMGSLVLGGGKVFNNNVYVGGEVLMDFSKRKKTEVFNKTGDADPVHVADYDVKGFAPQIDAKVGYVFKNDTLAYGKLGFSWSRASVQKVGSENAISKTKPGFVLGLGAERAFCKKFSAALEGDYNFGFKWQDKDVTNDREYTCNKGWSVRALVKHNVKY